MYQCVNYFLCEFNESSAIFHYIRGITISPLCARACLLKWQLAGQIQPTAPIKLTHDHPLMKKITYFDITLFNFFTLF